MAKAPRNSKPGIVWHEASDALVAEIKKDRADGMTFKAIEIKHGLRENNGMSAMNICIDKPKPKPKVPKAPKAEATTTPEVQVVTVLNPMEAGALLIAQAREREEAEEDQVSGGEPQREPHVDTTT